ncbi:PREDICTED: ectonucleotide pyrophosphatase/phosphodiesterase family member 2-like [Priapulus caudatus]|uniref:Ectonucleotide pyrophosphatase/phosphodiesterase family member 2-like n=1 Tax=Priapulus caudatus TaxID=37621 RepID=A0ABM1E2W7_PRICU|nr:PREDICTED: ectonucleotide pyrophosphatase/phosphodiesterase family member 2-like [Priapulus caudatus]
MGAISCDRRVMMEDYVYDVDLVKVYQGANSRIAINKSNYTADTLLDAVRCKNDHYNAFRKEEMPKRFHYSNNDRIDEVVLDVEEDWLIAREPSTLTGSTCSGGTHGWDDRDTSMHNGDMDLIDSRLNIDISISGPILSKHAPWGAPRVERFTTDDVYLLPHEDYVLGYSSSFKVPLWASFKTDQGHAGFMSELPVCVRADVRLDIDTHARCSDYSNDNAETANITMQALFTPPLNTTTENLYDAAILTNSVPQSTGFTIGVWRQIMDHVTRWAQIYGPLNIVTGPVFDYNYNGVYDTLDETRFIYDGSTLPFPTHYYVLVSKCSGKIQGQQCDEELPEVMAFVIPNRMEQETCQNITDYLFTHTASVRDVERLTGLWFYSDLDYYSSLKMKLLPVQTLWTTDN